MHSHIKNFKSFLNENLQLADKVFFNTGELDEDEKAAVLKITNGDSYTNVMSGILHFFKKGEYRWKGVDDLDFFYKCLKKYDKMVFPIVDFNSVDTVKVDSDFVGSLLIRDKIIKEMEKIPSVGIRNLKNEIRTPRAYHELNKYFNLIEYFTPHLSYLMNRPLEVRNKIYDKMFRNNTSMDKLTDFVETKENLIGGIPITREDILAMVDDNSYDLGIIYNEGDYMIVEVGSIEAINLIGSNSLWCFTYGHSNYTDWNQYSYNDIVYVIIDFSVSSEDSNFMHVIIKPIQFDVSDDEDENDEDDEINAETIYDLTNNSLYRPLDFLEQSIGLEKAEELLTFNY